jgi:CheY-like chemotaxis protein
MLSEHTAGQQTLPPESYEDLQVVHRNCTHLSGMIDDVLSLSQVESGRLTLQRERVDVAEIVQDALAIVRPLVDMKGIALEANVPDGLPAVYCDRTRIRQVVLNLVSNAARFTDTGLVEVSAEGSDGRIRVSVRDTGPGISAEDASRIFEPFAQGGQEIQRQRGGSGLGLCISRQFVTLHGGRMWLESQLGVGSTFTFELPVSPPMTPDADAGSWIRADWEWKEAAFTSGRRRGVPAEGKPHALVVDRSGRLSSELDRFTDLADFEPYPDWPSAAEGLGQRPTNAVIINAESADGLLALASSARCELPWTPVIGCTLPLGAQHALDAGAIGHLVKPVSAVDLIRALERLPVPAQRVLVVDDDADFVRMVVRMLRSDRPRLEVETASTGEEALALLRRQPVDLVFLDLMLPDISGWDVLAAKREHQLSPDAPVVVVSAQDPAIEPAETPYLLGALGSGFTVDQFLQCALRLPDVLLAPGRPPRRVPGRTAGA